MTGPKCRPPGYRRASFGRQYAPETTRYSRCNLHNQFIFTIHGCVDQNAERTFSASIHTPTPFKEKRWSRTDRPVRIRFSRLVTLVLHQSTSCGPWTLWSPFGGLWPDQQRGNPCLCHFHFSSSIEPSLRQLPARHCCALRSCCRRKFPTDNAGGCRVLTKPGLARRFPTDVFSTHLRFSICRRDRRLSAPTIRSASCSRGLMYCWNGEIS